MPKNGQCSVPCLSSIIDLQQECEKSGVKLSQETRQYLLYEMLRKLGPSQSQKLISKFVNKEVHEWNVDYEVESILDDRRDGEDGQMYYLIKWVDWGHEHNTWEPENNLYCKELLQEYKQQNRRHSKKRKILNSKEEVQSNIKKRRLDELFQKLLESKILDTLSPLNIFRCYSEDEKKAPINSLLACLRPKQLRKKKIPQKILRQETVKALQIWEDELNNIIKDYDPAPLTVENNVDLEGPPENFIYINERKEGLGVTIPKDPLIGCDCEDCYQDRKSCCTVASGSVLAYYKSNGRLRVPRGVPIYECNIRCKCGPNCLNRVAQKGRKHKVCIFRTPNGRGWGVKTLQNIKKGSFVMEYVGEVVTNEEAERRGQEYDAVGRTYLFDLDFNDANATFAVDAGTYGNAAHFINHSCNPNLQVHVVWINTLDPQLPHICLYAKRDIQKNEELTFDYMSGNLIHDEPVSEVQDSNLPHQPEIINGKHSHGTHFVKTLPETKNVEDFMMPSKIDEDREAETLSSHNNLEQDGNGSHDGITGLPNGFINHELNVVSTPVSDTETVVERKNDVTLGEKSQFSMACLCGASNCRKFLFF